MLPNKQIADALTLGIVNDTAENVDSDFLMPALTKFGPKSPIKKSKLNSLIEKSYLLTPKKVHYITQGNASVSNLKINYQVCQM